MTEEASKARLGRTCAIAAVALAALLVVPGVPLAEAVNATAWDAAAQTLCAQRVATLPGGIYVAGTDHKGPLWTSLYVLAWKLTPSSAAVWYVIGALAVLVAGLTAEVVRRLVRELGGVPELALGVALALFAHLLFGDTEYAGALYSRNVTGLLTASAWLLALRAGRAPTEGARAAALAAVSGTSLGWAVQTMPTTALPALVVAAALIVALCAGWPTAATLRARWRPLASFAVCALAPLLLVPGYYALRGELADFWQQWWTYNQLYRQAIPPGVEWPREVAAGLSQHLVGPQFLLPFLTFLLVFAVEARQRRWFGPPVLLVVAWLVAECVGLSLSLRFFGHYFVLPLIPVAVLGGVAASRLAMPSAVRAAAPLAILLAALPLGCPRLLAALGALRDGETGYEARWKRAPVGVTVAAAVVDVVSELDEDVYLWARNCTLPALLRRRAPTRYVENRWLTGEIYGWDAPPDPRWILPGTEERWARDMSATPPAAVVDLSDTRIPSDSAVWRWRERGFVAVVDDERGRIDVARDRWAWIESARASALSASTLEPVEGTRTLADGVGGADLVCAALLGVRLPPGATLVVRIEPEGVELPVAAGETEPTADVVALARNGALVVLRDGVLVGAKRLPPGATRLVVAVTGGARAERVGVARVRPPWTAR